MKRLLSKSLWVFLVAALLVTTAAADMIFSNLPASAPYYNNVGMGVEGGNLSYAQTFAFAVAVGFVTTDRYKLDTISLTLGWSGSDPGPLDVYLLKDDGGLPGKVIEDWALTTADLPLFGYGIDSALPVTLTADRNIVLQPDTEYWVAAFPGSDTVSAAWMVPAAPFNGPFDDGPEAGMDNSFSPDGGTWFPVHPWLGTPPVVGRLGLEVTGTTVPVPEPCSFLLVTTGLASVAVTARGLRK